MKPQPLIAVKDIQTSTGWYESVLGFSFTHRHSEHGYEQLMSEGEMVLQLHHWDAHGHSHMGNPKSKPYGNGVLLWFQTDEFDDVVEKVKAANASILDGPKINTNANHREIWLKDPDGYVVVIAGAYSDLGK